MADRTNTERVLSADVALQAYLEVFGQDPSADTEEFWISDLITDLLHLAAQDPDVDTAEVLARGLRDYEAES